MPSTLKEAFAREMSQARTAYGEGDLDRAFGFLERAHVLGQRHLIAHMVTHWWMLKVGVRAGSGSEARGQVLRMCAVIPGYLFGWVPMGNTGGVNVSPVKPMPIPADLAAPLAGYRAGRGIAERMGAWAIVAVVLWVSIVRGG